MSKYVKDLITQDLRRRLDGVDAALLVSVEGMDANANTRLRKQLRAKGIQLLVVRNSLARRATEGTVLAAAFEGAEGFNAVVYGADIVALAKEITRLARDKQFEKLRPKGGVLDGARIAPEEVEQISKWPSREEQLSILVGQILSPWTTLASQLTSPGGALASQIQQLSEKKDAAPPDAAAAP